ncbi:hypothetical protein MWU60_19265 [Yoonia sp. F2084L]|uniref:hypothetical protein n=1 Tax=Yoonia sp. F2084L TaxID=2926419 RepID=UPI001FF1EF86|nr:hypothetical protein [Yoonia sp. F2084L]MCK0097721.1 hypothetical protein [Yoonia sp. F2084L]
MINKSAPKTLDYVLRTATLLAIAGCTSVQPTSSQEPAVTIPQAVVNIADPRQNLTTAGLREQDNCYWYQHTNPLEVTLLPLRTIDGRPICAS